MSQFSHVDAALARTSGFPLNPPGNPSRSGILRGPGLPVFGTRHHEVRGVVLWVPHGCWCPSAACVWQILGACSHCPRRSAGRGRKGSGHVSKHCGACRQCGGDHEVPSGPTALRASTTVAQQCLTTFLSDLISHPGGAALHCALSASRIKSSPRTIPT